MAEISSLLGLITDDQTRQALIAQMENMFDNAPDEERLIQEIGNPTKVAVALIRYADSGKITPAAAPVVAPAQAQPRRAPQPRPRAEQYRPMAAAAAQRPAPSFTFPDLPEEPDEPETDEAPVLDGQLSFDEQPADDDGYYDEQPADNDGYYDEQPADDDGYYDEQPGEEYGEEYDEEYYDDYEPEYKTNVFLAILYTLGAIIIGVPVFAVLLVLDLAVLAIGAVCGAAGVSLIMTAFIGLPVVAGRLAVHPHGHRLGQAAGAAGPSLVQKGDRRMKKAWKTILIIALCILIVGEIVLGVGLATGGSPDRIWEAAYEHYDIGAIFALIKSSGIADLLASIGL